MTGPRPAGASFGSQPDTQAAGSSRASRPRPQDATSPPSTPARILHQADLRPHRPLPEGGDRDRQRSGARAARHGGAARRRRHRRPGARRMAELVIDATAGRGHGVIRRGRDGAHGTPVFRQAQKAAALLPDAIATELSERVGVDPMAAVWAFRAVRRCGTVSIIGVYDGRGRSVPDPRPVRQWHPGLHGPGPRPALDACGDPCATDLRSGVHFG
jgi:hypothetical protein